MTDYENLDGTNFEEKSDDDNNENSMSKFENLLSKRYIKIVLVLNQN